MGNWNGNSGIPPPPLPELDVEDGVDVEPLLDVEAVEALLEVVDRAVELLLAVVVVVEVDVDVVPTSEMIETVPAPEFAENTSPLAGS